MSQQLDLFDTPSPAQSPAIPLAPVRGEASEGERRKREGMERATWGKERLLGHAREIAHDVARGAAPKANGRTVADGLCTADDVAAQFEREGIEWLGNAAGHIFFHDKNWEFTGRMVKSERPHANCNLLRVWKRKVQG
jgi:hypothetical protein